MLNVIMLSVLMLSVIVLNVVVPLACLPVCEECVLLLDAILQHRVNYLQFKTFLLIRRWKK
jgi:hypothetical protein